MATLTQANGPMAIATGLGPDEFLLTSLEGQEQISGLSRFRAAMVALNDTAVPFEKVVGQPASIALWLPGNKKRYFNGIVNRLARGERDETFTSFEAEIVPAVWLLTKRVQSRIFQHISVPEILQRVLAGFDVRFDLTGEYEPRNYCVQYRESDFAFASRLMEEEGIFYFFADSDGVHQMVVADTPGSHPDLPHQSQVVFEKMGRGVREDLRVLSSEKMQEVRSGKYTLWDHTFELPHKHLEAERNGMDSVAVGTVTHPLLAVGGRDRLEIYDFPGEYAQRFDGIDRGGGERPTELEKIFQDNKRTVQIRMQQEDVQGLEIRGTSSCRHFAPGYKFTLTRHFDGDGTYVLTKVSHYAHLSEFRSGSLEFRYENSFSCIPAALPYRPVRATPRPTIPGPQTAVVVGPAGEEIFCDKYGRVKVQFHWDRQGKYNADSSCWLRVSQPWAGSQWGTIALPRIGQEVVVDFLEGDPDAPIIIGRVYNAEMMPPYALPGNKTQSGMKSRSSLKGTAANFNEIRFEDKKGSEQLYIHAEKNQDIEVENDETHWVGHDRTKTIDHDETTHVKHDRTETVDNNETITIHGNRTETVDKNETITIHQNRTETVDMNETITVHQNRTRTVDQNETVTVALLRTHTVGINEAITVGAAQEVTIGAFQAISVGAQQTVTVGAAQSIGVGANQTVKVGGNASMDVTGNESRSVKGGRSTTIEKDDALKVGKNLVIDAGESITIKTGSASIMMKKDGTIVIKGKDIKIEGSGKIKVKASSDVAIKGSKVGIN